MTIDTQKLLAKYGSISPVSAARLQEIRDRAFRRLDDNARGDSIYVRANEAIELVAAAQALDDAQAALDAQTAEIARLRWLVAEMADNDTYETEYDGRMYSICHGCGAQDGEPHRRPDCLYIRARAALAQEQGGSDGN